MLGHFYYTAYTNYGIYMSNSNIVLNVFKKK